MAMSTHRLVEAQGLHGHNHVVAAPRDVVEGVGDAKCGAVAPVEHHTSGVVEDGDIALGEGRVEVDTGAGPCAWLVRGGVDRSTGHHGIAANLLQRGVGRREPSGA